MRNNLVLLTLLTVGVGLISCNNNQSTLDGKVSTEAKAEIVKINNLLKQYEEPSQLFKVAADKPTKVTGRQGTTISINPDDLINENGKSIGENIEVELKELINQEQLLRTNAQTTSNGQILVSGGAYFINMTSNGQQLKLKKGKSLSVEFPKFTSKEMSLFYGQRDTLEKLNWEKTEQKFESKLTQKIEIVVDIDSLPNRPLTTEEKKLIDKVYKAVKIKQFGWINCDMFKEASNKTNLEYAFNEKDSIVGANVYLVFKEFNSVIQNCYTLQGDKEFNSIFENVPVGSKTQLIAFSIKKGKLLTYKSNLTIKENETVQLTLKETNQDEIGKIFNLN